MALKILTRPNPHDPKYQVALNGEQDFNRDMGLYIKNLEEGYKILRERDLSKTQHINYLQNYLEQERGFNNDLRKLCSATNKENKAIRKKLSSLFKENSELKDLVSELRIFAKLQEQLCPKNEGNAKTPDARN